MTGSDPIEPVLERLLHRLERVLPAQAPIQDFVHHNTLHGFQHLPFREAVAAAEAVNGTPGFLPPARFREYFHAGRIDLTDLAEVLDETPQLAVAEAICPGVGRRQVLLAGLLADFAGPPAASWAWWIEETRALTRARRDLPPATRERLLGRRNEAEVVGQLWRVCVDLQHQRAEGGTPRPEAGEAATLWHLRELREAAASEQRDLVSALGDRLTLRGLMRRVTGRDVLRDFRTYLVRHLASHLDQGVAAWSNPARDRGLYAAWRASARTDPHFALSGLSAWEQTLERLPEHAGEAIAQALRLLGIEVPAWERYLERLAMELPGWSGMFLWRSEHPGYAGLGTPVAMADYLAVRLILEHVHCQTLCGLHFKTEASLPGLRGYFRRHPFELLVRLALYSDDLPEWLADQAHRLVRAATARHEEERDSDWLPVARLLAAWRRGEHEGFDVEAGATPPDRRAWTLFVLCQHLGVDGTALARLGLAGADALLDGLAALTPELAGWIWLRAYERHYREQVFAALTANHGRGDWNDRAATPAPPRAQLLFCMDDREEGIRRHLEEGSPDVETLGAAAHFEAFIEYTGLGDAKPSNLCPVVAKPTHAVTEVPAPEATAAAARMLARRARRIGWKERLLQGSRRDPVRGALASLAAAPVMLGVMVGKALAPGAVGRAIERARTRADGEVQTRLSFCSDGVEPAAPDRPRAGFTDDEQTDRVHAVLRNTGLTHRFAPLVVIVGHGSSSLNNPHLSAYDCGACSGRHSGPNARLLAAMANRPAVRRLLRERGIDIPAGTWFVGCEHNTCDDSFTWLDRDALPSALAADLGRLTNDLQRAGQLHAQERCRRFASAPLGIGAAGASRHAQGRRFDYSQARPELGHVTNAAVFVGRRAATRGVFFDRRMFLISYDPSQDPDGRVLEPLLLANAPVGAGISLEYYFSTVDNERYGCGTKVVHNITGLFGVMEGTSSDLRPGLPRQMIEIHEAMRLLIVVEHELPVLDALYARQRPLQTLVGNGWVQLAAKDPRSGRIHRFVPVAGWIEWRDPGSVVPRVGCSGDWIRGQRGNLPPALVDAPARGAS
jgi:uncharacterized protein YbcC (UPF0753/DUF2309 family)